MDDSNPKKIFEESVSDIMSEGNAVDLIPPWAHISIKTTPKNTGMPLSGIGSAITVTPAGTTPFLHFIPGYFIESTGFVPVKLTNYFFRERVARYEKIKILDLRIFRLYLKVTPLVDSIGNLYFDPESESHVLEQNLIRILNCPTFYADNKDNFSRWKLSFSDITQKLVDNPEIPFSQRNFNILLDIFPGCFSGENDYVTSLTADIDPGPVDGCGPYPSDFMYYRSLYPASETAYRSPSHRCKILKRHISPIGIGEPKLCSLPLFRTEFVIENPTDETLDISLLQIQENIIGYEIIKSRLDEQDALFYMQRAINDQLGEKQSLSLQGDKYFKGITLKQKSGARRGDMDGEMHIGVFYGLQDEISITCSESNFSEENSVNLINSLHSGRIATRRFIPTTISGKEVTSGAVCVSRILKPGETATVCFITALDFPHIRLKGYSGNKKYVEYFPDPGSRLRKMLEFYLNSGMEKEVSKSLPRYITNKLRGAVESKLKCIDQLTQLLANGMAFLAESTIWDDSNNLYIRECVDYPYYNSLDVYFYGSFGLIYLLPEADTYVIRAITKCIFHEDADKRRYSIYRSFDSGELPDSLYSPRRVSDSVPHDMGGVFDMRPDAYSWKDVKAWKDLAPKYVLLVLRNYRYTKDLGSLRDNWPAVICALEFLSSKIERGHCIPFINGTGDTFDNLSSYGISIYSASLWVAGLRAASEIARILGDEVLQTGYGEMADAAQEYLRKVLWDEDTGYYHHYSMPLSLSDLDCKHLQKTRGVLESLGIKLNRGNSLGAEDFVMEANKYIYDSAAVIPESFLQMYTDAVNSHPKNAYTKGTVLSNKLKRVIKKYSLYAASDGLISDEFKDKISQESDDIFADQLLADLYLSLLGLQTITSESDRKRALKTVFSTNYKINNPNVGASNLVTADGESLPEIQAQDVWVGIQFSIAASLLDCKMFDEFNDLVLALYKNIYITAKIPFGVPEGFNNNHCVIPEDITNYAGVPLDKAKLIVADLKEAGLLSDSFKIVMSKLDDNVLSAILHKYSISGEMSKRIFKLLKDPPLKYTAGRYFRAGMVYSILAVMEKMHL